MQGDMSSLATLAKIGALLPKGHGFIERIITITGDNLENPGNYLAPIGTPLRYILDNANAVIVRQERFNGM
jgi:electron transport complex protein RnfC